VTEFTFDDAGRLTKMVEDKGTGTLNRETQYTYNADGRLKYLTAKNTATNDQVTKYVYGTSSSDSLIYSVLLRQGCVSQKIVKISAAKGSAAILSENLRVRRLVRARG